MESMFPKNIYLILLLGLVLCGCLNKPRDRKPENFQIQGAFNTLENKSATPKAFAVSTAVHVLLDSASSLKVKDSLADERQLMQLDGKAHFTIAQATQPIVIYTGMMKLTTRDVEFSINAYSESPGQSLKVLNGQLIATKSYPSDFPNTDTLHKGEMILINRDIDLMEKETFDTSQVPASPGAQPDPGR